MLIKVLAPGYYARRDTRTPVRIGIMAMVANMVCNHFHLSARLRGAGAGDRLLRHPERRTCCSRALSAGRSIALPATPGCSAQACWANGLMGAGPSVTGSAQWGAWSMGKASLS